MPFSASAGVLDSADLDVLHRVLTRAANELIGTGNHTDKESLASILIDMRLNGVADEDALYDTLMKWAHRQKAG